MTTATRANWSLTGVETVIGKMSNRAFPHLTRFRPPFGEPYQAMRP
jgi:hypothetical protein